MLHLEPSDPDKVRDECAIDLCAITELKGPIQVWRWLKRRGTLWRKDMACGGARGVGGAVGVHGRDPGIGRTNVELEVEVLAWTADPDPANKLMAKVDRALGIKCHSLMPSCESFGGALRVLVTMELVFEGSCLLQSRRGCIQLGSELRRSAVSVVHLNQNHSPCHPGSHCSVASVLWRRSLGLLDAQLW